MKIVVIVNSHHHNEDAETAYQRAVAEINEVAELIKQPAEIKEMRSEPVREEIVFKYVKRTVYRNGE